MCVYVPCGRAKVKRSPAHLASLCGAGEKPPQYRVGIALTRRPGQGVGYMINCGTERERELSGGDGGLCVPGEPNRLTRLKRECGFVLMSSASTRGGFGAVLPVGLIITKMVHFYSTEAYSLHQQPGFTDAF